MFEDKTEIDFLLHFLPVQYFKDVIIPATNEHAKILGSNFTPISFEKMVKVLGIFYILNGNL